MTDWRKKNVRIKNPFICLSLALWSTRCHMWSLYMVYKLV
jgi:hypothetical protein